MKYIVQMLLGFVLLMLSQTSYALGSFGHQLVCQASYNHLTDATKQKVDALMALIPADEKAQINNYLHRPAYEAITFAKGCNWADAIKHNDQYDSYKPWHYINTNRASLHIQPNECEKDCVTQAILTHEQQLHSLPNSWKRTKALLFLGHWLGDIHQPLHVSFASDWGGNKVAVNSLDGKCTNLHWLWDSCIISRSQLSKDDLLASINKQWLSSPINQWQQTTVWQWADESLQLVRDEQFQYCHYNSSNQCLTSNHVILAENYQQHYFPIVVTRLTQAAVRLTGLLEKAL